MPTAATSTAMASANIYMGSLVFDCEVEERTSDIRDAMPRARSKEQLSHDKEKLIFFAAPVDDYAGKLLRDVRYFVQEEQDPDAILLATKLSAVGYSVNVRTALGGGTACFRNLRHEFLTVRGQGDHDGVEFIVEPRFREHFVISHPLDEYSELLAYAPDVFVGTGSRLLPIVQTLCALMAESFEQKGLTLPPWRRTQSMLSKWLPHRARDMSFARISAPPQRNCDGPPGPPHSQAPSGHLHQQLATPHQQQFSRISDPVSAPSSQPQQQWTGQLGNFQQGVQGVIRQEEWCYESLSFIPFGGAGGCSSDTEGPSPPAPEVVAAPAGAGAAAGQSPAPRCRAGGPTATSGGRTPRGQSSLLAAHLQLQAGPQALAAHRLIQTQPPAHWGEAPIHKVRMGFHIAPAATSATSRPDQPGQEGLHPEVPARAQPQPHSHACGDW